MNFTITFYREMLTTQNLILVHTKKVWYNTVCLYKSAGTLLCWYRKLVPGAGGLASAFKFVQLSYTQLFRISCLP